MSYLDSAGQDQSPSFLQQLARSLGLDQTAPPANRQALASALAGQPAAPPGAHYAQLPGPPLLLSDNGAAPQPAQAQSPGPATPMRGSVADMRLPGMAPAAVTPQGAPATPAAAPSSIVVPGYEAKGPLTRAQVVAASDDDKTMPAEEDWDAAAKAHGIPSAASTPQPAAAPANAYATAIKAEYATAMAGHNAEMAAARAAAAAGTPAAYALAQGHLATADHYLQMATAAQAKYDETLKPGTRTLADAELTPAERAAGGEWQQSATGERSQVGGTAGDTTRTPTAEEAAQITAAGGNPKEWQVKDGQFIHTLAQAEGKETSEIQNFKFDQQNRQAQGLPPISFSDWNTQKTLYGKAERPLIDINGKEIDPSLTGDELLQALPPVVANHAKAIAEIREKWPSGTEQARQPQLQQALAAAQQLDPTLNQTSYQTRQSMKNSAESGSGRINVANLANNTALFHSNSLADAILALNNSNNTILNAAINSGAGPTGGIIPGATSKADDVKQFKVARDAVANELERSFHGVGTTAEQAVARQISDLDVNDAPQTQLGALKKAQELLQGKIEANEADYKDTMGDRNISAWERDHGRQFGFITPAAKAAGDRVAAMYENVKGGKGFHGFEPGAPQVGSTAPAPAAESNLPRVSTPEEARKLPSGTQFIDPNGVTRRVP